MKGARETTRCDFSGIPPDATPAWNFSRTRQRREVDYRLLPRRRAAALVGQRLQRSLWRCSQIPLVVMSPENQVLTPLQWNLQPLAK
jgi:hypothetical protein